MTNSELSAAWKRESYVGGNPSPSERLVWAYRFHRANNARLSAARAALALDLARRDIAGGKTLFESSACYGWNPAFAAYGSKAMRWIEKPAACGLRFVGYADSIADLRHTGWYVDNDQMETVRGVVFQLPGRDGKPLFVPGYDNACNGSADNGGPVCLDFGDVIEGEGVEFVKSTYGNYWTYESNPAEHDGCRDAARRADRLAELMAESEREYQAASAAGARFAELGDEITAERQTALELLAERRAARANGESYPAICATIHQHVRAALHSIDKARQERDKLREGDYVSDWLPGFYSGDKRLQDAFNEGAGETVFAC